MMAEAFTRGRLPYEGGLPWWADTAPGGENGFVFDRWRIEKLKELGTQPLAQSERGALLAVGTAINLHRKRAIAAILFRHFE